VYQQCCLFSVENNLSEQLQLLRLRDASGRVYILRNGQVHSIVNYSREYVYALVEVGVAAPLRFVIRCFHAGLGYRSAARTLGGGV
jgi:hypothetical protein